MYPDTQDELPQNVPPPLGKSIQCSTCVDVDLAGGGANNMLITNRHPRLRKYSPLDLVIKRQNNVESSTFGAEFIAMRILVDILTSFRYKLRMFGVTIDGPVNIFCDYEAAMKRIMIADLTLKRKNVSISYHNPGRLDLQA